MQPPIFCQDGPKCRKKFHFLTSISIFILILFQPVATQVTWHIGNACTEPICDENHDWSRTCQRTIDDRFLECVSVQPIMWKFSISWINFMETQMGHKEWPLKINTEVKHCSDVSTAAAVTVGSRKNPRFYTSSILELDLETLKNLPNSTDLYVACTTYKYKPSLQDNFWRSWTIRANTYLAESSSSPLSIRFNLTNLWSYVIGFVPRQELESMYLTNDDDDGGDEATGKCFCENRSDGQKFPPSFIDCGEADFCEIMVEDKTAYIDFRGELEDSCHSNIFQDWNITAREGKGGLLVCNFTQFEDYSKFIHYFAFKGENVLLDYSNEVSFNQFLEVSGQPNLTNLYVGDWAGFSCTGPQFLFVPQFQWTLFYNGVQLPVQDIMVTHEYVGTDVRSSMSVFIKSFIPGGQLRAICSAQMRITDYQPQTSLLFELGSPIKSIIECTPNTPNQFQFRCDNILDDTFLTWQDEAGQIINSSSCEDDGCEIGRENWIRFKKCMNKTITCTARRKNAEAYGHFTPQDCHKFLTSAKNCAEAAKSVTTTVVSIVTPLMILLVILATILYFVMRRQARLKKYIRELTTVEIEDFTKGSSTFDPHDPHAPIMARPYDESLEIPRDCIKLDEKQILGSGQFGIVFKGLLCTVEEDKDGGQLVAVKTVKADVGVDDFKAFLSEIKLMSYLGRHDGIVCLIGASTSSIKNREALAVVEFCAKGDLLNFLRKRKPCFRNLLPDIPTNNVPSQVQVAYENTFEDPGSQNFEELTTLHLLKIAQGIAQGMTYLSIKNVIHGDLAARNVLLTEDLQVKISDFGLSRQLLEYSVYVKKQRVPLPFKWMSIEAIKHMYFSVKSDVWSFAVVLYEMFTLGGTPYPGVMWDTAFLSQLVNGYRLERPTYANQQIYSMMMNCWKVDPLDRPSFDEIQAEISKIVTTVEQEGSKSPQRYVNF